MTHVKLTQKSQETSIEVSKVVVALIRLDGAWTVELRSSVTHAPIALSALAPELVEQLDALVPKVLAELGDVTELEAAPEVAKK